MLSIYNVLISIYDSEHFHCNGEQEIDHLVTRLCDACIAATYGLAMTITRKTSPPVKTATKK